jgi:threonine dehydratase
LTEATVVGNVLVQAITAGRFSSIADARKHVSDSFHLVGFEPQRSAAMDEAANRYRMIEEGFGVSVKF